MKVGEKARLVCPSEIAYGDQGQGESRPVRRWSSRSSCWRSEPTPEGGRSEGVASSSVIGAGAAPSGGSSVKIHEYQGKAILAQYGVPVPRGRVAYTADEAVEAAKEPRLPRGREGADPRRRPGQGRRRQARAERGRVRRRSRRRSWACACARTRRVRRAASCAGCWSSRAWTSRVAGAVPRDPRRSRLRAARRSWPPPRAGWRSRRWPRRTPKAILREWIDPRRGFPRLPGAQARASASACRGRSWPRRCRSSRRSYRAFEGADASLVEINPFLVTKAGDLVALDAKINFDDNALFRHPELVRAARPRRRGAARGRGLASTASTTSSSRAATSAAW